MVEQDLENKEELADALPAWFWACVDMAYPDEQALLENLSKAPPRMVALYQFLFQSAAEAVCDYWDGPCVPELDLQLSEDATEDFCKWVVCQGEAFWRSAIDPGADLPALVRLEHAAERDPSLARSDLAASTIWRLETIDDDFREELEDLYEEFEEDPSFLLAESQSVDHE